MRSTLLLWSSTIRMRASVGSFIWFENRIILKDHLNYTSKSKTHTFADTRDENAARVRKNLFFGCCRESRLPIRLRLSSPEQTIVNLPLTIRVAALAGGTPATAQRGAA